RGLAGASIRIRALSPNSKPQVIALEEHYLDPEVARHWKEGGPEARPGPLRERLEDVGTLRLREMDEAGIDIQVLSHSAPATQRIRLVLSGVFDKHPGVKIILGHLGESLPFSLWRIDMALSRDRKSSFRDTFREHFWITTSGNFSTPSLICCVLEMGVDRILFSVDYPFVPNPPGVRWMDQVPLGPEDRAKILSGNAKKLLKI